MKKMIAWFFQTATVVGTPTLIILLAWGVEKTTFTLTCATAGYQCRYAFGAAETLVAAMDEIERESGGMRLVPKK